MIDIIPIMFEHATMLQGMHRIWERFLRHFYREDVDLISESTEICALGICRVNSGDRRRSTDMAAVGHSRCESMSRRCR